MTNFDARPNIIVTLRRQRQKPITQQEMAKKLGVSRATYIKIEAGEADLSEVQAKIFCEMLGLPWQLVYETYKKFDDNLRDRGIAIPPRRSYSLYEILDSGLDPVWGQEYQTARERRALERDREITEEYKYVGNDPEHLRATEAQTTDLMRYAAVRSYLSSLVGGLPYATKKYQDVLAYLIEVEYLKKTGVLLAGGHYRKYPEHLEADVDLSEASLPKVTYGLSLEKLPPLAVHIIEAYAGLARIRNYPELLETLWLDRAWKSTPVDWNIPYWRFYLSRNDIDLADSLSDSGL